MHCAAVASRLASRAGRNSIAYHRALYRAHRRVRCAALCTALRCAYAPQGACRRETLVASRNVVSSVSSRTVSQVAFWLVHRTFRLGCTVLAVTHRLANHRVSHRLSHRASHIEFVMHSIGQAVKYAILRIASRIASRFALLSRIDSRIASHCSALCRAWRLALHRSLHAHCIVHRASYRALIRALRRSMPRIAS